VITAFVLLSVEADQVKPVADALADLDGVAEVHSVAGRWDLVAVIRVGGNDDLADLVTDKIRAVRGIVKSETLIGFKVVSRHDLERMFAIGLEA
jgi:DNA-binding Lrp family transcriptional regulator